MGEMRIRGKRKGFTAIYNSVLRDGRLSLKTKGLFAVMQSFPDTWEYSIKGLCERTGEGRDSIRGCLRQLEAAGYLLREQAREGGKFGAAIYDLLDQSMDDAPPAGTLPEAGTVPLTENPSTVESAPWTEKPTSVQPTSENPTQYNKQVINKTSNKTPVVPGGDEAALLFDRFWAAYPRKTGKEPARRAWKKLSPDLRLCRVMAAALERQKQSPDWRRENGRYIPYPATWLNQRRWEDELPSGPGGGEPEAGRVLEHEEVEFL